MKHVVRTVCDNGELEVKYLEMLFYKEFKCVFDKVVSLYGRYYKWKVKEEAINRLNYLVVRL